MTLEEEVKLLREKVELLERVRELESKLYQPREIPIYVPCPSVKPWEPPYIVTC